MRKAQMERRVLPVRKAQQAHKAQQATPDHREQQVRRVFRVFKD